LLEYGADRGLELGTSVSNSDFSVELFFNKKGANLVECVDHGVLVLGFLLGPPDQVLKLDSLVVNKRDQDVLSEDLGNAGSIHSQIIDGLQESAETELVALGSEDLSLDHVLNEHRQVLLELVEMLIADSGQEVEKNVVSLGALAVKGRVVLQIVNKFEVLGDLAFAGERLSFLGLFLLKLLIEVGGEENDNLFAKVFLGNLTSGLLFSSVVVASAVIAVSLTVVTIVFIVASLAATLAVASSRVLLLNVTILASLAISASSTTVTVISSTRVFVVAVTTLVVVLVRVSALLHLGSPGVISLLKNLVLDLLLSLDVRLGLLGLLPATVSVLVHVLDEELDSGGSSVVFVFLSLELGESVEDRVEVVLVLLPLLDVLDVSNSFLESGSKLGDQLDRGFDGVVVDSS